MKLANSDSKIKIGSLLKIHETKRACPPALRIVLLFQPQVHPEANFSHPCNVATTCTNSPGLSYGKCGWFCNPRKGVLSRPPEKKSLSSSPDPGYWLWWREMGAQMGQNLPNPRGLGGRSFLTWTEKQGCPGGGGVVWDSGQCKCKVGKLALWGSCPHTGKSGLKAFGVHAFIHLNNPMMQAQLLSPFHRWGNWGSERSIMCPCSHSQVAGLWFELQFGCSVLPLSPTFLVPVERLQEAVAPQVLSPRQGAPGPASVSAALLSGPPIPSSLPMESEVWGRAAGKVHSSLITKVILICFC